MNTPAPVEPCGICGNLQGNIFHRFREMMFGTREIFDYFECARCGCLQLLGAMPADMSQYYPKDYYAFQPPRNLDKHRIHRWYARAIMRPRATFAITGAGAWGKLVSGVRPVPVFLDWLRQCRADFSSAILDVGCGAGNLLLDLYRSGFSNLTGIDPYLARDVVWENGVTLEKKELGDLHGVYDVIVLNHSFEHMREPLSVFKALNRLLSRDGIALVRVPTVSSWAWRHYGANWVQIDAPRHLFLHSWKSMEILAKQADLTIQNIVYDSTGFQFWGSEMYVRGLSLQGHRSMSAFHGGSLFTRLQMKRFRRKADELNARNMGDQFSVYLKRRRS